MPKKTLLPMLLTTMVLLMVGAVVVHYQFPAPHEVSGQGNRDQISRKATAVERQAGIKSIVAQLDAFRRDDYKTAITFQSSDLKRHFASTATFRTMMKQQYPQFANYKSATFGVATADASGRQLIIAVKLTGHDGVTVQAAYYLVLENNAYRVAGVSGGTAPHQMPGKPLHPQPGVPHQVAPAQHAGPPAVSA